MDKQLLDILACPRCKSSVEEADDGKALLCKRCQVKYPVRDGIPVMLVDEGMDIRSSAHAFDPNAARHPPAHFRIIDGPDVNMTFQLEKGSCRAIGRASADPNKTSAFKVDIALELDETTRRVIHEYISKQFRKAKGASDSSSDKLGSFRRAPDVTLTDSSLSRLHAMIFYDDIGIGVLDLVSKNGTFVNGDEVESKLLGKGDVVEMGETTIAFEA